ncbi:MAG: bifunctional phosphopantothenoylcysteine decarboxylase/phosphopantothenate--cysteine ligase CoaBC [Verrucomicrobia bacterium]|nr:bifunctional phosphopantothenoylcysteine decarboxylase/phosphopantothenate--cysteine ligase CoaBC [Verrucomicrobiota bacterium]
MPRLRLLITAGPTREPIDPVRFISNRSSGKMGYALADAALRAGHRVTLVSGPVSLRPPRGARLQRVETAREMRAATLKAAGHADVIIMAAAVADYQPARIARHKIKKRNASMTLPLKRTPDILSELGSRKRPWQILVGFAAETACLLKRAREKLKAKNLDMIVANRVGVAGTGFESDYNQATILNHEGVIIPLPRMTKRRLARRLIGVICSGDWVSSRNGSSSHRNISP